MKFEMHKDILLDVLSKSATVATRGIKSEYPSAGRLTIEVKPNEVDFITSNGCLESRFRVDTSTDEYVKGSNVGTVTIDVNKFKSIATAIGGAGALDHKISIETDGKKLFIQDKGQTKGIKKSKASMVILKEHHNLDFKTFDKYDMSYTFPVSVFCDEVRSLIRYKSPLRNKVRYQMLCLHFVRTDEGDEVRFICGDGMRFAVAIRKIGLNKDLKKSPVKDKMYILPADQADILASLTAASPNGKGGKTVTLSYKNASTCHITFDNGGFVVLKGIPKIDYVAYHKHAFNMDKSKSIAYLPRQTLVDGMNLVNAVKDPDIDKDGNFHSVTFNAASKELVLEVDENKFHCEYSCESELVALSSPTFKAEYAAQFLTELSAAGEGEHIVFYCIDETSTIIAESANLDEKKDDNGVPLIKNLDRRLVFFFASATTE